MRSVKRRALIVGAAATFLSSAGNAAAQEICTRSGRLPSSVYRIRILNDGGYIVAHTTQAIRLASPPNVPITLTLATNNGTVRTDFGRVTVRGTFEDFTASEMTLTAGRQSFTMAVENNQFQLSDTTQGAGARFAVLQALLAGERIAVTPRQGARTLGTFETYLPRDLFMADRNALADLASRLVDAADSTGRCPS